MITVLLQGGLGNQMFQYAAATALAVRLHTTVGIDRSFYRVHGAKDWCRPYALYLFELNATMVDSTLCRRLASRILPRKSVVGRILYPRYDRGESLSRFQHLKDGTTLFGYYADVRFFSEVREQLLTAFTFIQPMDSANQRIAEIIGDGKDAVSIHIRRGDYLSEKNRNRFPLPSIEWYRRAMAYLTTSASTPLRYFFFSDDMTWVKEAFATCENAVFVDCNTEGWRDMHLMTLCRRHIIANSTFSWWGAYLDRNPEAVVAPDWYRRESLPDGWRVLD